ncbi:uncharacterized protein LOC143187768 [Calliopsis andreniformis]|uniref:uncharacterized protein LOC143187768 n=1 Tax=Calliopsis andreniformis TaxID=337506 RepID=UPI003FCD3322
MDMDEFVLTEHELREQTVRLNCLDEYIAWEERCNEYLESLEQYCRVKKRPRLSIGTQQSLIARIAQFESFKLVTRTRFVHEGAGHSNNGLLWRELETAFENRVLTGVVINSDYIDPRNFLHGAKSIVLLHVRHALVKHTALKVNTIFNGEFIAEWYERCIVECTITLLEEFQERDTVISVKSYDHACFAWAVAAALYSAKQHTSQQSSYPYYRTVLNFENIGYPIPMNDTKKFETMNNISVNLFSIEENIKKTQKDLKDRHVILLYIENDSTGHFAWIKNLSRLVGTQLSKHKEKEFICDRCLHFFNSRERLDAHQNNCQNMNKCTVLLPSEDDKWLKVNNYCRSDRVPFVVYEDLECVLEKIKDSVADECISHAYQHHRVFSIGYCMHCSYDTSLSSYQYRRDIDCVSWFIQELKNLAQTVKSILSNNISMVHLTKEQWDEFHNVIHCHICEKPFDINETRVRDHCHLTGRYRDPTHVDCYINYKNSFHVPIVFHNLSGYDSRFIIMELANAFEDVTEQELGCRNYIRLRFIDSYKFLNTSFGKLASFLSKDKLKILYSHLQMLSTEKFDLLTSLTDEIVSESDYAHAENIWHSFEIKTLADIFENF